jgi:hypothetical protein
MTNKSLLCIAMLVSSVIYYQQGISQVPAPIVKERVSNDTSGNMMIARELRTNEDFQTKETNISQIKRILFTSGSKTDHLGNTTTVNEVIVFLNGAFNVYVFFKADLLGAVGKVLDNGDVYLYYPMPMFEYMNQKFQQFIDKSKKMVDLNLKKSFEINVRVSYNSKSVKGEISFSE